MIRVLVFAVVALLMILESKAQNADYGWWHRKHNAGYELPWYSYLNISPKFMGPNALPIPDLQRGELETETEFKFDTRYHSTQGDNTYDLFTAIKIPFGDRIMIETYFVAIEKYQMDTVLRDERFARQYDAKGIIGGDIYFATSILIAKEKRHPSLVFRAGLKTASGLHMNNARYTDSPGYYFDLSSGKTLVDKENFKFRPHLTIGFYAWQTNLASYLQNDAIFAGLGFSSTFKKVFFNMELSSYSGYIGNGDLPINLKFLFERRKNKINYRLLGKIGFKDDPYNTIGVGVSYKMRPFK